MKDFSPLAITSAAVGFPARLCIITRTDGTIYRIAESDIAITVSGDTFQVIPGIQISAVKHTSNGEMPSCQIVAVHSNSSVIPTSDLDIGLFDGAAVQLYVVDRLNLTRKGLLFTGSISNISYDVENQVVFDVKGPAVSAKKLMTQKCGPMCRTDLYSVLCGINPASWVVTGTIATIVNAFNFTVSGLSISPPADGYFNNGVAVMSGGTSFEIANWVQSTSTITAYLPCNRILTVAAGLTLYPGCDKTLGANGCPKFSNQLDFQGEPHFLGTAAAAQQV
jgi:uncharacterized phage protein (TIGR02218 family)